MRPVEAGAVGLVNDRGRVLRLLGNGADGSLQVALSSGRALRSGAVSSEG
jgi:hypothetical protein